MKFIERLPDTDSGKEFWAVRCDICNPNIPALELEIGELCESARGDVVLDVESVGTLDSSGVGLLLVLYKRLHSRGIKLMLRNPGETVRSVLELTAMDRMLPYYR